MPFVQPQILDGTKAAACPALMINLFGGPCIGKTTMAANLFLKLKALGIEAANPEEHAKLAILRGQPHLLDEQLIILGQTWETLHTLSDKVDAVVVDSPLLLCSVYAQGREASHFHQTVIDFHQRLPRINLLLTRNTSLAYSQSGRREDSNGAVLMDGLIRDALHAAGEAYIEMPPVGGQGQEALERVAQAVAGWLDQSGRGPFLPPTA